MRLQNNPQNQALADKKAREDGVFFFADYVGIHDDKLVYQSMHQDSVFKTIHLSMSLHVQKNITSTFEA